MENQSGHHIKILRIDRGGEYVSNEFLNLYKNHDIRKQFTVWYTPQKNGVAERNNITIMDMACNMMEAKHLSNEYWVEAIVTAIYSMNRCPKKRMKNEVPQEA